MHIRKILMAGIAGLAMSMLVSVPVSAHGHHRQSRTDTAYAYPVCTVEDCTEEGCHLHDGEYYCGYDHEDGYCDGSCRPARSSASGYRCGTRRHGCH